MSPILIIPLLKRLVRGDATQNFPVDSYAFFYYGTPYECILVYLVSLLFDSSIYIFTHAADEFGIKHVSLPQETGEG